jgi:hypothetical protein
MEVRPTRRASAISRMLEPAACILVALPLSKTTCRRPNLVPLCFALLMPARTRSRISSRSNSATEAKMWSRRRDVGFDSSVSMLWEMARNRTP